MNVARWVSSIGDVEPADAGERAAGDDDVVEGDEWLGAWLGPAVAQDPSPRAPSARRSGTRPSTILARTDVELARLDLREEADLAEVDAEDRDVDLGDGADGPQERAVATEDDEGVGGGQFADERLEVARLGCHSLDARASGTSRRPVR